MKHYNCIRLLTAIFCLMVSTYNFGMELDARAFWATCREIDNKNQGKLETLFAQVTNMEKGLETARYAQYKLDSYTKEIVERNEIDLYNFKKTYQIIDDQYKNCMDYYQACKTFFKQTGDLPLLNVNHDKNMPEELSSLLKMQLYKEGCDHRAINLLFDEEMGGFAINAPTFARDMDGFVTISDPGKICITSQLYDCLSFDAREGLCMWMAKIVASDDITVRFIVSSLNLAIKDEDWMRTVDHFKIAQSALLVALQDSRSAHCIKELYTKVYFAEMADFIMTKNVYEKLSAIELYWRVLAGLKEYNV